MQRIRRSFSAGPPPLPVSDSQYELLFEGNPHAMYVANVETLEFLAVNGAALQQYGYTRDEFLTMTLFDIRPPEDADVLREAIERATTFDGPRGIWRHRRKDGSVFDVEITAQELTFHGQQAAVVLAVDVTAQQRIEKALRRSEQRYRDLFENAWEPIATVDLEDVITEVNAAFELVLGYGRDELIGTDIRDYMTPASREMATVERERKLSGEAKGTRYEQEFIAKDGRTVILEVSTRVIAVDGEPIGVQGTCRDITARAEAEAELRRLAEVNRRQALHDGLTGLANRSHFRERIEHEIAACRRTGREVAVLLIDLDRFKEINDTLGHHFGDLLLVELARRFETVLRRTDTVARLGGDEFGMLLAHLNDSRRDTEVALARTLAALEEPIVIDGLPLSVELSIGVAFYPGDGDTVERLLQHADVAMYVAKEAGVPYAFYASELDRHDPARLALVAELRRAIDERELVLQYQPKMDVSSRGVTSVEALLRWHHPLHGLVPPGDFIPLAEPTGLIHPLTMYVLDEALRQCRAWEEQGHRLDMAVNISMRNLLQPTFPADVARLLQAHRLAPGRLTLEITEGMIVTDPTRTRNALARLSALGVRISIDDFGIGYTSLGYLGQLELDQIKVDRSFVMDMATDDGKAAIVRSIVKLGHDLGLEVVAEGVETEGAWESLEELGCDTIQGYYVSRPLDADALTRRLEARLPPRSRPRPKPRSGLRCGGGEASNRDLTGCQTRL
jgi:diguanylate cyclase (GGDEF)-like protein/PAS domain S-box-containing protein